MLGQMIVRGDPRIRINRHRAVRQLEVRERCFEWVSSQEERQGDAGRCSGGEREMLRMGLVPAGVGVAASVVCSESSSAQRGSYIPLGME